MPHDLNGNLLKAGDRVNIPCTIKSVREGEYCTTEVELDYVMAGSSYPMSLWVNTNQIVLRKDIVEVIDAPA